MVVNLTNLRADRRFLGVTVTADSTGGMEAITFKVGVHTFLVAQFFAPGETKDVIVAHNLVGVPGQPVEVGASGVVHRAMLSLTGDEDWPYPSGGRLKE